MAKVSGKNAPVRRKRTANLILLGLGILVIVLAILSFLVGRYPISPDKVVAMLADRVIPIDPFWTDQEETIFFNVRLPRVVMAMLVGCCLSSAGAAYQGTFQNPLVSPDILGASQGAAFGAAVAILLGFASFGISAMAMCVSTRPGRMMPVSLSRMARSTMSELMRPFIRMSAS